MKFTSRILLLLLLVLLAGLLSSNIILKKQYDAIDKSDLYWTYAKILEQPFWHLKITGGNGTHIAFEQSAKPSVRLLQDWVRFHGGEVKAAVKNDTLFINFDFKPANEYEKFWLKTVTPVRIFSPQLLSVTGFNTNFEMFKLKQKSINVNMTGKSGFEVESMLPVLDTVNVYQRDSAQVTFEMSPDYVTSSASDSKQEGGKLQITFGDAVISPTPKQAKTNVAFSINTVNADLKDYTILDIGHAQIQNLQLHIADSSAIILSGGALRKINDLSLVNQ